MTTPRRSAHSPRAKLAPELSLGADDAGASRAAEQLALCAPDHLRRLEQPLKYGFADRSSARKGLEVAAGVAIADRLGAITQTAGPPIGRHGYMAIVWLGSRWLQLEQVAAGAVPFTQYRLLHDFGWAGSGKNARKALKRTLLNLQEARWEGDVNDSVTGRKTHEDHFGIIDRILWPVVNDGRVERLGYIFLGSWFLEQLRHEAGVYIDWEVLRELPPSRESSTGFSRMTASRAARTTPNGRRTGSVTPFSPPSGRHAPGSATTWRQLCAPVRRSRPTRRPGTGSRGSGSRSRAAGDSSWWCGGSARSGGDEIPAPSGPRRRRATLLRR